jgi:hypothetical protein
LLTELQYRVWGAILKHFLFSKQKFTPATGGPAALFQPVISSSRSPVTECDYNLHKSNSTYFSDLDVTRTHIFSVLFRRGIQSLQQNPQQVIAPDGKPAKGRWSVMLGAVECSFKKEIKPYEGYEMWSRILCWDRKWIYIVTHFVKKGAVMPDGYTLDDGSFAGTLFGTRGRASSRSKKGVAAANSNGSAEPKGPHKAIFATALSKYVTKLGRLTIHPEVMMNLSGVLPPRPGGWATMSGTETQANGTAESVPVEQASGDDEWTWQRVEAENKRGLEYAEHFAVLEGLHEEFTGEDRPAIGAYRDFLW